MSSLFAVSFVGDAPCFGKSDFECLVICAWTVLVMLSIVLSPFLLVAAPRLLFHAVQAATIEWKYHGEDEVFGGLTVVSCGLALFSPGMSGVFGRKDGIVQFVGCVALAATVIWGVFFALKLVHAFLSRMIDTDDWKHRAEAYEAQAESLSLSLDRVRVELGSQLVELRAERDALLARKPLVAEDFRKLWSGSVASLLVSNEALLEVLTCYSKILDYGDKLLCRGVNQSGNGQAPPELLEIHASFAVFLNNTAGVLSKTARVSLRMDEMLSSPGLDNGEPEPAHSFPAPNGPAQFFCASSGTLEEAKAKLRALRMKLPPDHVLPLELPWLYDLFTSILQQGSKHVDALEKQTAYR